MDDGQPNGQIWTARMKAEAVEAVEAEVESGSYR